MTIRPDGTGRLALPRRAAIVAAMALAIVACNGTIPKPVPAEPPEDPLSSQAKAFLQARSQPWQAVPAPIGAGASPDQTGTDAAPRETIEIIGAVEQPGQLVLGPYAQTIRQALDAMGGTEPAGDRLRIRPGGDSSPQLFAEAQQTVALIEIPLSALNDLAPVYVRPGDIIEVVVTHTARETESHQAAEIATPQSASAPPTPAGPSELPPQPVIEATSATEPEPQVAAAAEARSPEVAALRQDIESQLTALRRDVQLLQEDNAKLRARIELTTRPSTPAPAVASAEKRRPSPSDANAPSRPSQPDLREEVAEKPARTVEPAPAGAASTKPARTVRVSGAVKNPGTYSIDEVKTVLGAIRAAGDGGDSNLQAVEVRPAGQGGPLAGIGLGLDAAPSRTIIDLSAAEGGKDRDIPLRGGEAIFVPPARSPEPKR